MEPLMSQPRQLRSIFKSATMMQKHDKSVRCEGSDRFSS